MVAGLLTKGAGDRTAEQVAETIEGTGGTLQSSAGTDFLSINATVLTSSLPLAFELIGDAMKRPTFAAKELELLRTQTLSGLQVSLSQPSSIADRRFRAVLYGSRSLRAKHHRGLDWRHHPGRSPGISARAAPTFGGVAGGGRRRDSSRCETAGRCGIPGLVGWSSCTRRGGDPSQSRQDRDHSRSSARLGAIEYPGGESDLSRPMIPDTMPARR